AGTPFTEVWCRVVFRCMDPNIFVTSTSASELSRIIVVCLPWANIYLSGGDSPAHSQVNSQVMDMAATIVAATERQNNGSNRQHETRSSVIDGFAQSSLKGNECK
ncbi:unnamed protein product, partial [Ceratitis capitata]